MNCLQCELTRARIRAKVLSYTHTPQEIADKLSELYGERYYVQDGAVWRASKLPPFTPHHILRIT